MPVHQESLAVAEILIVDTVFFKRLYVLIYMHLASRYVLLAACPATGHGRWKRKGSSKRPSSMTETRRFRRELTTSLDRQGLE